MPQITIILTLILSYLIPLYVSANNECIQLSEVSEEYPPALCPDGFVVKGIQCKGGYCDNKILTCCPYMPDSNVDNNVISQSWSEYFSEEPPNQYTTDGFISGLACNGKLCDNISLRTFTSSSLKNIGQCYFGPSFSEENNGHYECRHDFYMSGLWCRGGYCDNISLYCCRAKLTIGISNK
jgi:hypothetical protein